jgi:hypothetical protein
MDFVSVALFSITYALSALILGLAMYTDLKPVWNDRTMTRGSLIAALFFTVTPLVNTGVLIAGVLGTLLSVADDILEQPLVVSSTKHL